MDEVLNEVGAPRSDQRFKDVATWASNIDKAPCIIMDRTIYTNPYKGMFKILNAKPASLTSVQSHYIDGVLYRFDSGLPNLGSGQTLCGDGWISWSTGRGTCSHHGGEAKPRGAPLASSLMTDGTSIEEPTKP